MIVQTVGMVQNDYRVRGALVDIFLRKLCHILIGDILHFLKAHNQIRGEGLAEGIRKDQDLLSLGQSKFL